MKRDSLFLLSLLGMLFFLTISCSEEKGETIPTTQSLTVLQAKAIYDAAFSSSLTKTSSDYEKNNMFYRKSFEPIWKTALPSRSNDVESVDVPVDESRRYYVTTHDKQGFYLTECHHSIVIVKSSKSGATGVYHHFFIPFRDSRDKYRERYNGDLYRGFHNNGFRDDYSGLEFYSNMNGIVIKYLWYINGRRCFSAYSGDGIDYSKKIHQLMNYYIVKGYGIRNVLSTKDGTQYLCPQCGHELNEFNGYYYCSECDWNEMDFWEQYLEECYIYGEGGGNGGDGWNDPDPINPDPDPNTGGGGNNGSGAGIGGNDQGDIPSNFVFSSSTLAESFQPAIDLLSNDCSGTELLSILSGIQLNFEPYNGNEIAVVPAHRGNGPMYVSRIICGNDTITAPTLFEELVHCVQIINQDYGKEWRLNCEVEAKFAAYRFAVHINDENAIPHNDYYSSLGLYVDSQTESNYLQLIQYVKNIGDNYHPYADTTRFPESASHRSMNNISSLFDCYEE